MWFSLLPSEKFVFRTDSNHEPLPSALYLGHYTKHSGVVVNTHALSYCGGLRFEILDLSLIFLTEGSRGLPRKIHGISGI
jgi:hypothetical protein